MTGSSAPPTTRNHPHDIPTRRSVLARSGGIELHRIAETYQEVLNEAARKGSSIFEVLALLIGEQADCRRQQALERRVHNARLPKRKLLEDYDFSFPEKIPKQAILRLFDCDFVAEHGCAVSSAPPEPESRICSAHWATPPAKKASPFVSPASWT